MKTNEITKKDEKHTSSDSNNTLQEKKRIRMIRIRTFTAIASMVIAVALIASSVENGDTTLTPPAIFFAFLFSLCVLLNVIAAVKNKTKKKKNTMQTDLPQQNIVTPETSESEPNMVGAASTAPTENSVEVRAKKIKKGLLVVVAVVTVCAVVSSVLGSSPFIDKNVKMLMDASGFEQELCENVYAQLQECGVSEISNIFTIVESDGTWYSCRISTPDYYGSGVVNITPEEGLYTFNWGGATIYNVEKLKKSRNLSDYALPYGADFYYMSNAEEVIKDHLKSPSTAEFPGKVLEADKWSFDYSYKDKTVTISSYVDAQNSFGATIRSPFTVVFDVENSTVTYVNLDGTVYK